MTTPVERMEAIMASLVQERSQMDRSNATSNKLNANLGYVQKRKDTENRTSATIDNKEVANGELGSSMTTNATDNTTSKKRKKMKKNNPDLGGILSTRDSTRKGLSTIKVLEVTSGETISVSAKTATLDANIESKGDLSEVASGKMEESKTTNNGNDAPKLTKSQKRNRSKALKKKSNADLGSSERREDTGISSDGTGDGKSSNSKEKEHTKVCNGEMGSSLTTNLNVEVEVQKKMEANPDCGVLSTRKSTEEGLSTTKVLEVMSDDMIPAKTATPDANTVSKGDHSEVASGKMEESKTTNNGNVAPELTRSQKRNRLKANKKKLNANLGSSEKGEDTCISSAGTGDGKSSTFKEKEHTKVAIGEIGSSFTTNLNGEVDVQKKMEAVIGETSLDINEAANTTSKKRKRKKVKNENPDLGGILSSRESTEKGSSTTKILEVKSCEMISATPDANMVSFGYHSEVASGKMKESEATNKALENKLNANQGSLEKPEDTENPRGKTEIQFYTISQSSIQDNPNTGVSSAGTVDGKSSNFNVKEHTEVANCEKGSSLTTNLNRVVEVQKAMETSIGNTSSGMATPIERMEAIMASLVQDRSQMDRSSGMATPIERMEAIMASLVQDRSQMDRSNATSNKLNADLGSVQKREDTFRTSATIDNKEVKVLKRMETAIGEMSSGTNITYNTALKKRKKRKVKNNSPDLGAVLSTHENTQEGLNMTKILGVKCNEAVSSKTTNPEANMLSKEHDCTMEVANGKTETTDFNVDGKDKREKKSNSKYNRPTLAEILKPPYSTSLKAAKENLDASKGEKASGSTSTDNPVSKKLKRKLNKDSHSSDVLSTIHESTQEVLSTTKVLEVVVSKGDHTEVGNGKTWESETTNNGNDASKLTKSQKKDRRRALKKKLWKANLGSVEKREDTENPNSKPESQFYSNTNMGTFATVDNMTTNLNGKVEVQKKMEKSSGATATDNTALKKRKREKKKNNSDLGDFSSTRQNTQEGLSTTKVLEVKNDEMASIKTATPDANMVLKEQDHTEVANGKKKRKRKPESKNTLPTLGENLNPVNLQNMEAADIPESKEQKSQKINNSASGDICENIILEYAIGDMSLSARTNRDVTDVRKEEPKLKGMAKKLLVLDVNGLLADVSSDKPKDVIADNYMHGRAVFKRPYLDDFLHFCFQRFHVAIWSSRTIKLDPLVYFLFRDLRWKLLFVWDACECTDSDIDTLEVNNKHVVVKDLRKIWDADGPHNKWVKGAFNESNTLLVDDSPYTGLLNPKYTGIFPDSYSYTNSDDNFLGPNGELQTYLEGLAATDDVKTYVEQHPFGQGVIDERNPDWVFYSSLIERLNDKPFMERLEKGNQLKEEEAAYSLILLASSRTISENC